MFTSLSPQKIANKKKNGERRPDKKANRSRPLDLTGRCSDQYCIGPGDTSKYAAQNHDYAR
jgi:hypothetical protein